jgi:O-antigen/teichoic acid export membrane protein
MIAYVRSHLQALVSIGVRGASVIASFAVAYYIGHNFGPLANGQYALVAQTAIFCSTIAVGGMDLASVRYFSAAVAYKVPLAPASLFRALGYSLGAGFLIALLLLAAQGMVRNVLFHGALPPYGVLLIGAILIGRTGTRMTAAILRSQGEHLIAQCVDVFAIPTIVTGMLALGMLHGLQPVLYATLGAGWMVALFGLWRTLRFTGSQPDALDVPFNRLLRTSLPLWLTTIAMNIADWYSLATAAAALGVYEAGLFRIAFQIGTALSFSANGLYNVFTSQISAAIALDDYARVARLTRSSTRLVIVLLVPLVVVLFVAGGVLLGLIGPEFRAALGLLRIFLLGQLLTVVGGPAGLVLAMSGHEKLNLAISSTVTGGLLVLGPLAAHYFGLYGLAVATACVPVAGNLANIVFIYRVVGINVLTGQWLGHRVANASIAATATS